MNLFDFHPLKWSECLMKSAGPRPWPIWPVNKTRTGPNSLLSACANFFFGQIARKELNNLEQLMITGKVDDKTPTGRGPIRRIDQIWTALDANLHVVLHSSKERNKWWANLRQRWSSDGRNFGISPSVIKIKT